MRLEEQALDAANAHIVTLSRWLCRVLLPVEAHYDPPVAEPSLVLQLLKLNNTTSVYRRASAFKMRW